MSVLVVGIVSAFYAGLWIIVLVAVAIPTALKRPAHALVPLLMVAGAAAFLRQEWAVHMVLVAGAGVVLGFGIVRRWTYGQVVAAVTAAVFVLTAALALGRREQWQAEAAYFVENVLEVSEAESSLDQGAGAMDRLGLMVVEHWGDFGLGLMFLPILALSCAGVSSTAWWLRRRYGEAGLRGSFREMRAPEWLVWPAILTALLWFADGRWPGFGLRPLVWNAGLVLASVYWINGLSIVAYGVYLWHPHPGAVLGILAAVTLLCGAQLPCILGLFDTWGDFRSSLRRWIGPRVGAGE